MILNAKEADYKSSERLILVCPICGEGVYLVHGHTRAEHARMSPKSKEIVLVKESVIPNSFAHFHGIAENCELKAKSINKTTIQNAIASGKGQRLKFIQRRFGQIAFENKLEITETIEYQAKLKNPILPKEGIEDMLESLKKSVIDFLRQIDIKKTAKEILEAAISEPDIRIMNADTKKRERGINWINNLEIDLHCEIVEEVGNFLLSKSGYPCLIKSMNFGFCMWELSYPGASKLLNIKAAKSEKELNERYFYIVEGISNGVIAFITGITWADAISEFSQKKGG
jgi:hypothetical protein